MQGAGEVVWTQIREPWFDIQPEVEVGVSSGLPVSVSPWAGVSGLTLGRMVDIGWAIDLDATGPFASVGVYQMIHVFGQYNLLHFRNDADFRIGIALEL